MKTMQKQYEILQPTQRWTRVGEHWYRETVVRLSDGSLRIFGIRA